jgi:mRNA interferase YafQ
MVRARVEPDLKERAEAMLDQMGLSATTAITLFYRQIIQRRALPFDVRVPNATTQRAMRAARSGLGVVSAGSMDQLLAKLEAAEPIRSRKRKARNASWTVLRLRFTGTFKRDRKRAGRRGKPLDKLDDLMRRLANEEKLEARFRDHKLSGEWDDFRECHLEPDWLLIYRTEADEITFVRTGTHSDLFDE